MLKLKGSYSPTGTVLFLMLLQTNGESVQTMTNGLWRRQVNSFRAFAWRQLAAGTLHLFPGTRQLPARTTNLGQSYRQDSLLYWLCTHTPTPPPRTHTKIHRVTSRDTWRRLLFLDSWKETFFCFWKLCFLQVAAQTVARTMHWE